MNAEGATGGRAGPVDRPLSDVFKALLMEQDDDRVTVGELVDALGHRGFGALMILLALPNFLPFSIPGFSALTGLPMAFFAAQLALGRARVWLPETLRRRAVSRADYARVIDRFLPWLRKAEALVRPRMSGVTHGLGERMIGVTAVALALLLALPIPFGNPPPAIAITLLSLGVLQRDGYAAIAGYVVGALAFLVIGGLVLGIGAAGLSLLSG